MKALAKVLFFAAVVLASVAGVTCRRATPAPPRQAFRPAASAWLSAADTAEAPLEKALADFDVAVRDSTGHLDLAARQVLAAARSAREALEGTPAPADLEYARREELIFLNHLVPGFQAFLEGKGGASDLRTLDSIRARAQAHRRRGREALEPRELPKP